MAEFDEDQHPRDEHGRFSGGGGAGGGLDVWAKRRAERYAGPLISRAEKTGGFSYKPGAAKADRVPTSGIMVSRDPKEGLGHVVEIAKMAERDPPPTRAELHAEIVSQVKAWLDKSVPFVKDKDDHYLGGWYEHDKKTGLPKALHLDISQRFSSKDRDKAIQAGRDRNQLSVWDVDKGEEIDTGGTGRTA